MHSLMRRAWVEIDLAALLRNAAAIGRRAGVPLLPMVKADAYGLGAVPVARALDTLAPWGFGVATVGEGEELRRAGIERPILLVSPVLGGDLDAVERVEITPALSSRETIERWAPTLRPWHLAVDTGMSRAGVQWNEVRALHEMILRHPPEGVFTHFHSAELDDRSRGEQETRFEGVLSGLPVRPAIVHAENGAAVEHRAPSRWTLARPGIFLYGVGSVSRGREAEAAPIVPEPVVAVRARVVELRTIADGESVSYDATWRARGTRRIATLAIGYADGYRRSLSNKGSVLVRGKRAPVAGVVTMDMTMIDVTDVVCEVGDVATLMGIDRDDAITVRDIAELAGLSPYEILTGLRGRLPRRYIGTDT
jgi:alanine racemase